MRRGPANFHAQYWRAVSLGGLAYGFDYDDMGNQSTPPSMPNATQAALAIHWNQA